ncbi:LPS export ABC transporter permease LptF [Photobacterium sp. TY 1-4]|uniref:LPS export ABC transporter permease LptF n=2 Tax=Pseudosulfitobacter koreensis TaxID=2968472 RepID=A0ABT1Z0R4_9RHOB|nr:LPS export ABC transporter permease LptF [Pseudosulfitobacter koreense]MCR8826727.1 LPS export ABC transporter permease LptF [Pseudosulfitobacter koreense]
MLSQFLLLFGFFSLVLVAVFWINRAVVLFDRLIGDGQTALVFLEFTSLSLPKLIVTVLPIATFAASVYVTNRLSGESELVVMQATGTGPWRMARPVLAYGLIVAAMMTLLAHVLVPAAQGQLSIREAEISRNVTSRLLTEGTFLSPAAQVTFYTRAIGEDGVLRDVFLSDRRNPEQRVIYTAAEAYLVRNDAGTTLIMVDGLAQRLNIADNRLSTAKFVDFSFDISRLVSSDTQVTGSIRNMNTLALLTDWDRISDETGARHGDIAEEVHNRFAQPLFCIVAALIGFSTLMIGGYSRFGVWREAVIAFGLLIGIDGLRSTFAQMVLEDAALWPMMYLPSLIGLVLVIGMLTWAAYPGLLRRRRPRMAEAT